MDEFTMIAGDYNTPIAEMETGMQKISEEKSQTQYLDPLAEQNQHLYTISSNNSKINILLKHILCHKAHLNTFKKI